MISDRSPLDTSVMGPIDSATALALSSLLQPARPDWEARYARLQEPDSAGRFSASVHRNLGQPGVHFVCTL